MRNPVLPLVALALLSCGKSEEARPEPDVEVGPEPTAQAPEPVLRKLTEAQFTNTVSDLFSPDLVLPTRIEPDVEADGLLQVGASEMAISPFGVEQYELSLIHI